MGRRLEEAVKHQVRLCSKYFGEGFSNVPIVVLYPVERNRPVHYALYYPNVIKRIWWYYKSSLLIGTLRVEAE